MHTAAHAGSRGVSVPGMPAASLAWCLAQASNKATQNMQLQAWHPLFTKKQVFWVSPAPAAGHTLWLRENPLFPLLSHSSEQWHHGDPPKVRCHQLRPMLQETWASLAQPLLSHLPTSHGPPMSTLHGHAPLHGAGRHGQRQPRVGTAPGKELVEL